MATGLGIVSFDGVGLDTGNDVYPQPRGGGEGVKIESRLIKLPGGGTFDPDTGVDRTPTQKNISEAYWVRGAEAASLAKVAAVKAKVGATGLLTRADTSTLTGRLLACDVTNIKTDSSDGVVIYGLRLTWEIPT